MLQYKGGVNIDNNKYLDPKYDVVFKCLFGRIENEHITKDFLEHFTGFDIKEITTNLKLELEKTDVSGKKMERDLVARDDKLRKYIMEMQRKASNFLTQRFMSYACGTYIADLKNKG